MYAQLLYNPQESMLSLFNTYESSKIFCNLSESNSFISNQINLMFYNTQGINEYLYDKLCHRYDYTKKQNTHMIKNKITDEVYLCVVHEYYIELQSKSASNMFLEILYQKNQNYVIIVNDKE